MASTFTPAAHAPDGIESNFDNPTGSLFPHIVATVSVSVALTTVFTGARLYAKRSLDNFGIEDYCLALTWIFFIVYNGVITWQAHVGIGRHIWDVREIDSPLMAKLSWAIELMYCALTWLAKATLLLQLQRIFTAAKEGLIFVSIQALVWANFAFYFAAFLAVLFECMPIRRIWDPNIETGYCIDVLVLLIAMGAINVLSDILILIIPIVAIWNLKMSNRMKLGVSAVFATGIISFIASICRLAYTVPGLYSYDSSYIFAKVAMWSLAEIATIILCTCFPMIPRFIKALFGTQDDPSFPYYSQNNHSYNTKQATRLHSRSDGKTPFGNSASAEATNSDSHSQKLYIARTVDIELESQVRSNVME